MTYDEYVAACSVFASRFTSLSTTERDTLPEAEWMQLVAEVTCETPGCPHGTQVVKFVELCNDAYSAHCGNCDTQITNIVGIFDDCKKVMNSIIHPVDDPWAMNAAMS